MTDMMHTGYIYIYISDMVMMSEYVIQNYVASALLYWQSQVLSPAYAGSSSLAVEGEHCPDGS